MRGSKVRGNNLGEGLGCRGKVQGLPGQCARVAGAMCKDCRGNVQGMPGLCKGCQGNVLSCENNVNSISVRLKVELGL